MNAKVDVMTAAIDDYELAATAEKRFIEEATEAAFKDLTVDFSKISLTDTKIGNFVSSLQHVTDELNQIDPTGHLANTFNEQISTRAYEYEKQSQNVKFSIQNMMTRLAKAKGKRNVSYDDIFIFFHTHNETNVKIDAE